MQHSSCIHNIVASGSDTVFPIFNPRINMRNYPVQTLRTVLKKDRRIQKRASIKKYIRLKGPDLDYDRAHPEMLSKVFKSILFNKDECLPKKAIISRYKNILWDFLSREDATYEVIYHTDPYVIDNVSVTNLSLRDSLFRQIYMRSRNVDIRTLPRLPDGRYYRWVRRLLYPVRKVVIASTQNTESVKSIFTTNLNRYKEDLTICGDVESNPGPEDIYLERTFLPRRRITDYFFYIRKGTKRVRDEACVCPIHNDEECGRRVVAGMDMLPNIHRGQELIAPFCDQSRDPYVYIYSTLASTYYISEYGDDFIVDIVPLMERYAVQAEWFVEYCSMVLKK